MSPLIKRLLDVVVALSALALLAPLMVVIAVLVKLDSSGPVFFVQERVGRGFRLFRLYKFRTMFWGRGPDSSLSIDPDPRVTRVGHYLRCMKLDELPQLINVLEGTMSLVGPRPELLRYVERFHRDYEELLTLRPGLTDPASLKYFNEGALLSGATDAEDLYLTRLLPDKIALAKDYAANQSLGYDLRLIVRTVFRVLSHNEHTDRLLCLAIRYRRPLIVGVEIALMVIANYAAFWLRFDGQIPERELMLCVSMLPWLLAIRGLIFVPLRLYEGMWRYTGLWDVKNICAGVAWSTVVFYVLVHWVFDLPDYPRSVLVIDSLLLVFFLGGIRVLPRASRELGHLRGRRVLIIGAGDAGESIVRAMQRQHHYEPVGFLDDDPSKLHQRIHGVPVLGSCDDLPRVAASEKPHEILVATPNADAATLRRLVKMVEPFNIRLTTLPNSVGLLEGGAGLKQVRDLSVEDLLTRAPVGSDLDRVQSLVEGKRVLVTGAGGSIGSELCRQLLSLRPELLLLYERYENGLHAITNNLAERGGSGVVQPFLGDVTNPVTLNNVLSEYQPHVIFHAAAHKHVHLVEMNPCEAVKNNIVGTWMVGDAAMRHGVERVILISTDKAVNPRSVMGATKRIAELVLQRMSHESATCFATVRFGNVLGSSGSVVPRFLEQINAGGPVTVTHPEIRRYFMLIPEAVQLVLQAAALAESGDTFALDMGEPIKVVDLARTVIRLSGHVPDEEIPIVFIGLRPGEKLDEQLVASDEIIEPSAAERIFRIRGPVPHHAETLDQYLEHLQRDMIEGDSRAVMRHLCTIVPTFQPWTPLVDPAAEKATLRVRRLVPVPK